MQSYLSIGPAPAEETPVQLGERDYPQRARAECAQFIEAIRQKLGREVEGTRLGIKSFPHDFGSYYEVVCYFDEGTSGAYEYALKCEGEAPTTWDEMGIKPPQTDRRQR